MHTTCTCTHTNHTQWSHDCCVSTTKKSEQCPKTISRFWGWGLGMRLGGRCPHMLEICITWQLLENGFQIRGCCSVLLLSEMPLRQIICGSDYSWSVKNYGDYFCQFQEKLFERNLLRRRIRKKKFAHFPVVSLGIHFSYLGRETFEYDS